MKPNVLFILTDQFRADGLGYATPNLNQIADRGTRFNQCFTTSPQCVSARISLAAEKYPHSTGVWHNMPYRYPEAAETWTKSFQENGYKTSVFGKTHLYPQKEDLRLNEAYISALGFDVVDEIGGPRACAIAKSHMTELWASRGYLQQYIDDLNERTRPANIGETRPSPLPLELYPDVYVGQMAKTYLSDLPLNNDDNWFCWVSFSGPHEPWDTPLPWGQMYRPDDMPAAHPPLAEPFERETGWIDQHPMRDNGIPPAQIAKMRANYAGNIALIDDQIGQILEVIQQRGELENTLIVFTSDHGEHNGDHGLIYKSTFLDPAIRIPLIVAAPLSFAPFQGGVSDALIELPDVAATIKDICALPQSRHVSSLSFAQCLKQPELSHRASVLSEFREEIAYVDDEWKVAFNRNGDPYMLIDRQNDPHESINMVGDPSMQDVTSHLQSQLFRRLMQSQYKIPDPRDG